MAGRLLPSATARCVGASRWCNRIRWCLADTFYANVALGRDISETQVWEALEAVQLAEVARSMSDGLYTQLGEQGQ